MKRAIAAAGKNTRYAMEVTLKIRFEVGDPRNFDSGDGTNTFTGETVEGLQGFREIGEDKEFWFVSNCKPISFKEMHFKSLLLISRYKTKKEPMELLNSGEKVVFNGAWRQDGGVWDQESLQAAREGRLPITGVVVVNATRVPETEEIK